MEQERGGYGRRHGHPEICGPGEKGHPEICGPGAEEENKYLFARFPSRIKNIDQRRDGISFEQDHYTTGLPGHGRWLSRAVGAAGQRFCRSKEGSPNIWVRHRLARCPGVGSRGKRMNPNGPVLRSPAFESGGYREGRGLESEPAQRRNERPVQDGFSGYPCQIRPFVRKTRYAPYAAYRSLGSRPLRAG